jgi:hypothetical protein
MELLRLACVLHVTRGCHARLSRQIDTESKHAAGHTAHRHAYPVVMILVPAIIRSLVPDVVRSVLSLI